MNIHTYILNAEEIAGSGRENGRPVSEKALIVKRRTVTMKKLIAILMILALVMGMAACGSPASGSASVADSAPAASDADSTPEEDDGLAMTGGDVEGHTVESFKA